MQVGKILPGRGDDAAKSLGFLSTQADTKRLFDQHLGFCSFKRLACIDKKLNGSSLEVDEEFFESVWRDTKTGIFFAQSPQK